MTGTMLSPHFSLAEFTVSQTAGRMGLENTPSPFAVERMRELCIHVLEPTREALGAIRITSGYRAPLVNWHVRHPGVEPPIPLPDGGQHPKGEAADIIPVTVGLEDVMIHIYQNAPFDQLIWEFGWVHVSYTAHQTPRGSVLVAGKSKTGAVRYARLTAEQIFALRAA